MLNRILLLIPLILILHSCGSDPLDVDVSNVDFSMEFERFDQRMFATGSPDEMQSLNKELIEDGGELYEFYVAEMLRSGSVYDDSIGHYLYYFVSDTSMKLTHADIEETFRDFEVIQEDITDMFRHLKYHLPEAPLPEKLITYNSAFNYGVISTNSQIGVGLDMYLGVNNRIIKELGFPVYVKEKRDREYLLVDIAHSWLATNVLEAPKDETFLSNMIYYGKLRYAIDAMLPDLPDHLKVRYTEPEYDWSLASENDIWLYIMDMNWVYSSDMKLMLRFFEEAPTTVGIEGSPGRIGQFMGWQMVRQYMEKNEDVTVEQMLSETNESKFLKSYKPEDE